VDDNEILRKSMSKSLQDEYKIFEANNGIEALNVLNTNRIDLILMDIVMPEKGGIEVLIGSKSLLKDKKIIIITGNVSSESEAFKNLLKTFGVSKILYKPFEKENLLTAIKEVLA
jgi:CheY-like chemotaxis protein